MKSPGPRKWIGAFAYSWRTKGEARRCCGVFHTEPAAGHPHLGPPSDLARRRHVWKRLRQAVQARGGPSSPFEGEDEDDQSSLISPNTPQLTSPSKGRMKATNDIRPLHPRRSTTSPSKGEDGAP